MKKISIISKIVWVTRDFQEKKLLTMNSINFNTLKKFHPTYVWNIRYLNVPEQYTQKRICVHCSKLRIYP